LVKKRPDRIIRLATLYCAKMVPEECNDRHRLKATRGPALVQGVTLRTDDASEVANGPLEPKQDRGKTIVTRLGHNDCQAQIAGTRFVPAHQRAAFAVEEAGCPGQFNAAEDHGNFAHAKTPSAARGADSIERMADTVNGR
jgi:hypothetical protein